jgi:hypothetical protein
MSNSGNHGRPALDVAIGFDAFDYHLREQTLRKGFTRLAAAHPATPQICGQSIFNSRVPDRNHSGCCSHAVHDDMFRLEITMDKSIIVHRRNRHGDLSKATLTIRGGRPAPTAERRRFGI